MPVSNDAGHRTRTAVVLADHRLRVMRRRLKWTGPTHGRRRELLAAIALERRARVRGSTNWPRASGQRRTTTIPPAPARSGSRIRAGAWISASAAVLVSCGGGAVNPLSPTARGPNQPPRINGIVATPASVTYGGVSTIAVTADDPDGDTLTYAYAADHGRVDGNGPQVAYTNDGATAFASDTVRVTVTDSRSGTTVSAIGLGLGGNPAPSPTPTPKPNPSPSPEPTPNPNPTPAPTPTPTPAPAPPSVNVSGGGSCHPTPQVPCSVSLSATASNGAQPLSYSWTGCASGGSSTANCNVTGLSSFTGTVTVTDALGRSAAASGSASGTNEAPGAGCPDAQVVPRGSTTSFGMDASDPDDGTGDLSCDGWVEQSNATIVSATCSQLKIKACDTAHCYSTVHFVVEDPWGAKASCKFVVKGS